MRFAVDARVLCRVSDGWKLGTVVALNYREDDWPAGRSVPYQVELDDGTLIFAPIDNDALIRASRNTGPDEGEQLDAEEAKATEQAHEEYRRVVQERYERLHPSLFAPSEMGCYIEPALRDALSSGDDERLRALLLEESSGIFSLDLFTPQYCDALLQEVEHFEAWCAACGMRVNRPNTMNNYGAILDDFGMAAAMDAVMKTYVQPLARLAGFNDVVGDGGLLESHHAFVVAYSMGKDLDLSFHVDSSDVTLNVCLGKEFEGGSLFFRGVRCPMHTNTGASPSEVVTYEHRRGRAILHRGNHRHGANKIRSGERINLILWCRAPKEAECSERLTRRFRESVAKRQKGAEGTSCATWCWLHPDCPHAPKTKVG